ncbi:MAG: hypothetical protein AMK70_03505 [Nitrospira bacterium SG8_35_1]|nr:MAG: hypothetical protein AMK70_03505 [Nitrospira bacterium SG8_35_1]
MTDSDAYQIKIRNFLTFAVVAALSILIVLECLFRVAGMSWGGSELAWGKKFHHIYGWELRPNYRGIFFDWVTGKPGERAPNYRRTIAINSSGFREDSESPVQKPKTTYRIITLGDSAAYGWGVESRDTYSNVLERKLNESAPAGRTFDVINAGVPGHTSFHGMLYLENKILEFKPDMIIVAYGWSDHMISHLEVKELIRRKSRFRTIVMNGTARSRVFQGLGEVEKWFNNKYRPKTKYRVSLNDFQDNLRGLVRIAEKHGVKVVMMTIQSKLLTGKVSEWTLKNHSLNHNKNDMINRHQKMNDIIRRVGRESNTVIVDMAEKFRKLELGGNKKLYYRPEDDVDDMHPSILGHSIIAQELYDSIIHLINKNAV